MFDTASCRYLNQHPLEIVLSHTRSYDARNETLNVGSYISREEEFLYCKIAKV